MLSGPFPSRALWPQAHRSSHPLADLLALEARPKRIAVWAPNGALFTSLYHYFPRAELFAIDSAAEAVGADAVVLAPTLAMPEPIPAVQLVALAHGLPHGGHLAYLQQTLTVSLPFATQWLGLRGASSLDPDVEAIFESTLRPLHRSERSHAFGVWREVLAVGRKGTWICE